MYWFVNIFTFCLIMRDLTMTHRMKMFGSTSFYSHFWSLPLRMHHVSSWPFHFGFFLIKNLNRTGEFQFHYHFTGIDDNNLVGFCWFNMGDFVICQNVALRCPSPYFLQSSRLFDLDTTFNSQSRVLTAGTFSSLKIWKL